MRLDWYQLLVVASIVWWIVLAIKGRLFKRLSLLEVLIDIGVIIIAILENTMSIVQRIAMNVFMITYTFWGYWVFMLIAIIPIFAFLAYRYYGIKEFEGDVMDYIEGIQWKVFFIIIFLPMFMSASFVAPMKAISKKLELHLGEGLIVVSGMFFFMPFMIYIGIHQALLKRFPRFMKEYLPSIAISIINVVIVSLSYIFIKYLGRLPDMFDAVFGLYIFYRTASIFTPPFNIHSLFIGIINEAFFILFLMDDTGATISDISNAIFSALVFTAAFLLLFGWIAKATTKDEIDKDNLVYQNNKRVIKNILQLYAVVISIAVVYKYLNAGQKVREQISGIVDLIFFIIAGVFIVRTIKALQKGKEDNK